MSRQSFDLIYIDTFAGSGSFSYGETMPLMGEDEAARIFAGSVKRALAIPAFKEYYFIEADPRNIASLQAIVGDDPRIKIIAGDANVKLAKLLMDLNWTRRRGVVFVDPCGSEADWSILRRSPEQKLWTCFFLFPAVCGLSQCPHDHGMLTPEKRAMVTRCLDNAQDWERILLFEQSCGNAVMFDNAPMRRPCQSIDAIEAFVTDRLKAIFPHVEQPARLLGKTLRAAVRFIFRSLKSEPSGNSRAGPIARHLLKAI